MAVIGAGRVGTAFAVLLERAGYLIVAASGRAESRERVRRYLPTTPVMTAPDASRAADVAIIGVPDDLIVEVSRGLASRGAVRRGQHVAHLSGSVSLEALDPAEEAGATILSLHPLQSFPDVDEGVRRLPGSGIAVTARDEEAAAFGEALARDAGGRPFRLADEVKPLYHAAAVFCANYLVAVEGMAEHLLQLAGVEGGLHLLRPLASTAFDRTFQLGPGAALTGPAARGDIGTIQRNLRALREGWPDAMEPYIALAKAAARLAESAGRIGPDDVQRMEEVLARWR